MSYIDSTLMKGEVVLYRTKPHWVVFTNAGIALLLSIIFFFFGPYLPAMDILVANKFSFYPAVALLSLLAAIFFAVSAYVFYQTSEYGITNKRILMKEGFIQRFALEIFLVKVESVQVYQSVAGRMLRYGSVIIKGVGGSKDPFTNIPNPLEFRRRVQEQLELLTEINREK